MLTHLGTLPILGQNHCWACMFKWTQTWVRIKFNKCLHGLEPNLELNQVGLYEPKPRLDPNLICLHGPKPNLELDMMYLKK
jgi:hypothetical protein